MKSTYRKMVNLRMIPGGRCTLAARKILGELDKLEPDLGPDALLGIRAHCQEVIDHGKTARRLRRRYAADRANTSEIKSDARLIDQESDRLLSSIYNHVEGYVINFDESTLKGRHAREFLQTGYPEGVNGITRQSFAEQCDDMEDLVDLCQGDLATHVQTLRLDDLVERLVEVTTTYRLELERDEASHVTYAEVKAAENGCHERICRLATKIMGDFDALTDEGEALRVRLLAPIHEQDEAVGEYNRRRRRVADVDPDSGEEDPADAPSPTPQPTPA